jgi:hypothetical protein
MIGILSDLARIFPSSDAIQDDRAPTGSGNRNLDKTIKN